MEIVFSKFQGTGNDFILLDNLKGDFSLLSIRQIQFLCDRKFGIGADGLIKINASEGFDFEMEYFNSDGSQSFCGNGARCAVTFAKDKIQTPLKHRFIAIDGEHSYHWKEGMVAIDMKDVHQIFPCGEDFIAHTGSPHYVKFSDDLSNQHTVNLGKQIRYSEAFEKEGINVNLVSLRSEKSISISTYERGVEDETLSCGTGATACALVYADQFGLTTGPIVVQTKGGELQVDFIKREDGFSSICLSGPAEFVFNGNLQLA